MSVRQSLTQILPPRKGRYMKRVGCAVIAFFVSEIDILGCTYLYVGEKEFG